jgi:hypothetical protein
MSLAMCLMSTIEATRGKSSLGATACGAASPRAIVDKARACRTLHGMASGLYSQTIPHSAGFSRC